MDKAYVAYLNSYNDRRDDLVDGPEDPVELNLAIAIGNYDRKKENSIMSILAFTETMKQKLAGRT